MHFAVQKDVFLTLKYGKKRRRPGLHPAGGAYDAPPDSLVGWAEDTPPRPHSAQRLRRFDSRAFGARYSVPSALNFGVPIVVKLRNDWRRLKWTSAAPFQYAAPCLWNELPTDLRHGEPRQIHFLSLSPITHGSLSSSSSPSSLSPLASSLTRSVFHSELKTWLPDWFYGHSDQLMFLFCSTAGSVCMVSLVC